MSITDELRKYAQSWRETPNLMDDLDAGDIDGILGDIEHIADCIDAEHERECKEQYACGVEHGIGASIDASMIQTHGYVELPKDADGVPWHIGDRTESGQTIEAMGLNKHGWYFVGTVNEIDPALHRHHAPTVEDVLRDMLDAWGELPSNATNEAIIAEYAAKLRELAESEEEEDDG